jgi:hypothetical protein
MPQALANAQVIGGVVVEIGADLSGVKAGIATTRAEVAGIDKLVGTVKLVADTTQLKATVARLTLPPVVVPLMLDMRPAMGQLAALRSAASAMLALPGTGGGGARGGGGGGAPFDFEGEVVGSSMQKMLPGSGGSGSWSYGSGDTAALPAAAASRPGFADSLFKKVKGIRGLKAMGAVLAAQGIMANAEAAGSAFSAYNAKSGEEAAARVQEGQEAISSIPFVGHLISKFGSGIYRGISATKNLLMGRGFSSDQGLAEEATAAAAVQDKKTEGMAARAEIGKKRREEARQNELDQKIALAGSPGEAALIRATEERDRFEEKGGAGVVNYKGRLAGYNQIVGRAQRMASVEATGFIGSLNTGTSVALAEAESVGLHQRGEGRAGDRKEMVARQVGAEQGLHQNMVELIAAGADPKKITAARERMDAEHKKNTAELTEFDRQTKVKATDEIVNLTATKEEVGLRKKKEMYAADLAAFDETTRQKVQAIEEAGDKQGAEIEKQRRAAIRGGLVQQQQEQIATTNASLAAAGRIAGLRAGHQYRKAELEAFDAETERQRAGVDAANRPAWEASRKDQRDALLRTQQEASQDVVTDSKTRIAQAQAHGTGMDALAGYLGQVAGMKGELRHADVQDQPAIVAAQEAELAGMRDSILHPRRYATEYDFRREAAGGPGGDAQKEQTTILKTIADYLKALVDKGPAAAAAG